MQKWHKNEIDMSQINCRTLITVVEKRDETIISTRKFLEKGSF